MNYICVICINYNTNQHQVHPNLIYLSKKLKEHLILSKIYQLQTHTEIIKTILILFHFKAEKLLKNNYFKITYKNKQVLSIFNNNSLCNKDNQFLLHKGQKQNQWHTDYNNLWLIIYKVVALLHYRIVKTYMNLLWIWICLVNYQKIINHNCNQLKMNWHKIQ